jgi:Tfp pilus assembly protein PilF
MDPDSMAVSRNLALVYLETGDPRKTLEQLGVIFKRTPNDYVSNRLAARALVKMRRYKDALPRLDRAAAAVSHHGSLPLARVLAEAGAVRLKLGMVDPAIYQLQKALSLAGSEEEADQLVKDTKRNLVRARAIAARKALDAGEARAGWHKLKQAMNQSNVLPDEEAAYVTAIGAFGAYSAGKIDMGRRLANKLRGAAAKSMFLAPFDKIAQRLLAVYGSYLSAAPKAKQKAARQFAKWGRQLPSPAKEQLLRLAGSAMEETAEQLFVKGRSRQARQMMAKAVAFSEAPPSAAHRHNAAVINYQAGDKTKALAALRHVRRKVPLALCNLAAHHVRAGAPREAYNLFKQCAARGAAYPSLKAIVRSLSRVFGEI